uniref:Uncharacterized protein n=1 Tax=Scleropages formosus TaxID=113540 RepID=A0A8C9V4X2_SCLFO
SVRTGMPLYPLLYLLCDWLNFINVYPLAATDRVAKQNCLALDYLLSAQGGTCAVVNSECYTYIPDNSKHINSLADHIREISTQFHDFHKAKDGGLIGQLSSMLGSWGK